MKLVAIVGSRDFADYPRLSRELERIRDGEPWHVISGGAKGADSLAERYARTRCLPFTVYSADWGLHGRSAGFIRNDQIVDAAEMLIAFWDGTSKGTEHCIEMARRRYEPENIIVIYTTEASQ